MNESVTDEAEVEQNEEKQAEEEEEEQAEEELDCLLKWCPDAKANNAEFAFRQVDTLGHRISGQRSSSVKINLSHSINLNLIASLNFEISIKSNSSISNVLTC